MSEGVPAGTSDRFRVREAFGDEADAVAALRRRVFCDEQGLFAGDDRDEIDPVALALVAVLCEAGRVIGTVRIHEPGSGEWWGSRLAVERPYRTGAVGAGLVQVAVGTALHHGCRRFRAHIQADHKSFFRRLHWVTCGELVLHGRPHLLVEADLAAYAPLREIDDTLTGTPTRAAGRIAA